MSQRLRWLDTNVLAIAAARWVTWPCSVSLTFRLDRTQNHMIAILLDYKHNAGTSVDEYFRLRGLMASKYSAKNKWSIRWATAVLAWQHHCMNPIDSSLWHKSILKHQDPAWLIQQRLKHSSGSRSKTCTRVSAGNVASRWSEQIEHAKSIAPNWRALNKRKWSRCEEYHCSSTFANLSREFSCRDLFSLVPAFLS
jgi:hypothetical protein